MASLGSVLILDENLPVPFDRRVWMEATSLRSAGFEVSVICPVGHGHEARYECIDGVHVYRHSMPPEGASALGYLREYAVALYHEFRLAAHVRRERGFHVIHTCNPPDLLFLVALWHKLRHGTRMIFDQHDINPELYVAKYGRKDVFYHLLRLFEWLTFRVADVVVSTNESYRSIALGRGGKSAEDVFVVRSGPDLDRFSPTAPNPAYRRGRSHLVGYVGVMGEQEGIDCLLEVVHHVVHERGRDDVQFMLVGGGTALERMQAYAKKLEVDPYVEFSGRVPDEELLERLSSCDVCVNPDPVNPFNDKSTMNKVLEYMALGKPIVQFDTTEGRNSAGDAAAYVAADDHRHFAREILRLLDEPERARAMGRTGRCRMERELEWSFQSPRLIAAHHRARRM